MINQFDIEDMKPEDEKKPPVKEVITSHESDVRSDNEVFAWMVRVIGTMNKSLESK